MMQPPHIPPQATEQPKPNVTWTLMAPPQVAFQMWIDGSVKIIFPPDKANEVIAAFENHLTAFKSMKNMLDNPPKKCTACRGAGQIMVKQGDSKQPVVCSKCSGSGKMNFIPPNVVPSIPATVQEHLPVQDSEELTDIHQSESITPAQAIEAQDLEQMKSVLHKYGYEIVSIDGREEKTEPPSMSIEDEEEKPVLSLEQLAALART